MIAATSWPDGVKSITQYDDARFWSLLKYVHDSHEEGQLESLKIILEMHLNPIPFKKPFKEIVQWSPHSQILLLIKMSSSSWALGLSG